MAPTQAEESGLVTARPDSGATGQTLLPGTIDNDRNCQWLITISKSDRTLKLYRNGTCDTAFLADFGRGRTLGDKEQQGDLKTPEGEFKVCFRNSKSQFYKALMIDYPLPEDAERGLTALLISQSDYRRIIGAHDNGEIPDQYTELGGLIEIHGFGGTGRDWTLGCVAVKNSAMDYLFERIKVGTTVVILP